jgi:hypothetical protein
MSKEEIKAIILKKRPNLANSSVTMYISTLTSLLKKLNLTDINQLDKADPILEFLKDTNANVRKTILSALFILTENQKYKEKMLEDCNVVNQQYKQQKMSKSEKENWIPFEQIQEKYNELLNEVNLMFASKKPINNNTVIQFFLVGLMSGCGGIPPRRSTDYSSLSPRM